MTTAPDASQSLGNGNLEAATAAFGMISKRVQTIASEIVDYNRRSLDSAFSLVQDLVSAKTVGQAVEIQANYWKSSAETLTQEMNKLREIWTEVASETAKSAARKSRTA